MFLSLRVLLFVSKPSSQIPQSNHTRPELTGTDLTEYVDDSRHPPDLSRRLEPTRIRVQTSAGWEPTRSYGSRLYWPTELKRRVQSRRLSYRARIRVPSMFPRSLFTLYMSSKNFVHEHSVDDCRVISFVRCTDSTSPSCDFAMYCLPFLCFSSSIVPPPVTVATRRYYEW